MIRRFSTELLNPDGTFQTQTINGAKNILIHAEKETYEYQEIIRIVDSAYYLKKEHFGWDVRFIDTDRQHKALFIRSLELKACNASTKGYKNVHDWIDHVYDREEKQIDLFEEE